MAAEARGINLVDCPLLVWKLQGLVGRSSSRRENLLQITRPVITTKSGGFFGTKNWFLMLGSSLSSDPRAPLSVITILSETTTTLMLIQRSTIVQSLQSIVMWCTYSEGIHQIRTMPLVQSSKDLDFQKNPTLNKVRSIFRK